MTCCLPCKQWIWLCSQWLSGDVSDYSLGLCNSGFSNWFPSSYHEPRATNHQPVGEKFFPHNCWLLDGCRPILCDLCPYSLAPPCHNDCHTSKKGRQHSYVCKDSCFQWVTSCSLTMDYSKSQCRHSWLDPEFTPHWTWYLGFQIKQLVDRLSWKWMHTVIRPLSE